MGETGDRRVTMQRIACKKGEMFNEFRVIIKSVICKKDLAFNSRNEKCNDNEL